LGIGPLLGLGIKRDYRSGKDSGISYRFDTLPLLVEAVFIVVDHG